MNLESLGFQGFRLCSVRIKIRYFNGNRRALRVGAFPKNPTRRWRYQNKTIVLFFMDSSMRYLCHRRQAVPFVRNVALPFRTKGKKREAESSMPFG